MTGSEIRTSGSSPSPQPPHRAGDSEEEQEPEEGLAARIGMLAQIGILLPAAAVIGWAIGLGLDIWLGRHWISIAGIIVGAIAGFVQVYRIVRPLMR